MASFAGVFLSMGYLTTFNRNMTSGRGYIGLAANNMVNGSPLGALFTALLFGMADASSKALQMTNAVTDFVMMILYVATIVGLVVISIVLEGKCSKAISKTIYEKQES